MTLTTMEDPVNVNELPAADRGDDLRLMTVVQAADYLSMSRGSIYNLMRSGAITSVHIGRARRIPFGELHRFVRSTLAGCKRLQTPAGHD